MTVTFRACFGWLSSVSLLFTQEYLFGMVKHSFVKMTDAGTLYEDIDPVPYKKANLNSTVVY